MEGPTPVSALIHAATMVTAGIYMLLRCSPLLEYAPDALSVIAFLVHRLLSSQRRHVFYKMILKRLLLIQHVVN